MSNKLLMKIMMVLVVLICIFLLVYTFTKTDDTKKGSADNYSESNTENNLEKEEHPTLDKNEENKDETSEQKPSNNETSEQKPVDDETLNDNESFDNESAIIDNKKIILEDRTKGTNCAQAIEYFYEDREYRYYFTCIKSNNMYVIVDKKEYKLVYALNNGIVTIQELEKNGYKFAKESKNLQDR